MENQRNIAVSIILTIVTCGIYGLYWFIVLTDEVRSRSENYSMPSGGVCFLLGLITCGIYYIYWAYMIGKNISSAKEKKGLQSDDNAVLYLILQLFGFGIIVYALAQNDLNVLATMEEKKA